MKKIWLDISYELKNKTGIGEYILTIQKLFNINNIEYENIECKTDLKGYRAIIHFLWMNSILLIKTLINKPDIIIFPNFRMPFFKRSKTEYIVVIHDLAMFYPKFMPSKYSRSIFQYYVKNSIKNADKIITVSESVKKELIKKFKLSPQNIYIVYNLVNFEKFNTEKTELPRNLKKDTYILSISNLNVNKNISSLIKTYQSLNHPELKLVLVGKKGTANLDEYKGNSNIIFTGYLTDEEIALLYQNALLYVFPSLYEGFGIPLIEAQYSECPVLCSDIPVFREVAGDGAEFCKPDEASIAQKLEYLISNEARRKELIQLGKANVNQFSLNRISEQFKEVINE